MDIPKSAEELKARLPILTEADIVANTTNQSIMTLMTAAGRIGGEHPEYAARINAWIDDAQKRDIRITECITDGKGDRSLSPGKQPDPDAYTRVVERRSDGVVVRGSKLHITGASLGHETMVIPTKAMKPGEEDYAIAFAIPVNAPSVKIVNTSYAPRHEDDRSFPCQSPEPHAGRLCHLRRRFRAERAHLPERGNPSRGQFAHSLGLWERLGGLTFMSTRPMNWSDSRSLSPRPMACRRSSMCERRSAK